MAGIDLTTATARLTEYLDAEQAVLSGQAYSIAGRSFTRADLAEIRRGIDSWNARVKRLSIGGGARVRRIIPA